MWLPTFLERYDPDTIRYHLTVNMPELHDTDFTWREYVDKVNNELIGTYANYVNRVLTLVSKASIDGTNPILDYPGLEAYPDFMQFIQGKVASSIESMERQRFKEALRRVMDIAQEGNGFLQRAEPWKYLKADEPREREKALRPLSTAWHSLRALSILTHPFMPFQSQRLWEMIGEAGKASEETWDNALESDNRPETLPDVETTIFQIGHR